MLRCLRKSHRRDQGSAQDVSRIPLLETPRRQIIRCEISEFGANAGSSCSGQLISSSGCVRWMARALWKDGGSQGSRGCGLSRLIAGHRGPNASHQRHHLAERGGGVKLVMVLVLVLVVAHRTTTKESTCITQGQLTTKVRTLPTCSLQNG